MVSLVSKARFHLCKWWKTEGGQNKPVTALLSRKSTWKSPNRLKTSNLSWIYSVCTYLCAQTGEAWIQGQPVVLVNPLLSLEAADGEGWMRIPVTLYGLYLISLPAETWINSTCQVANQLPGCASCTLSSSLPPLLLSSSLSSHYYVFVCSCISFKYI